MKRILCAALLLICVGAMAQEQRPGRIVAGAQPAAATSENPTETVRPARPLVTNTSSAAEDAAEASSADLPLNPPSQNFLISLKGIPCADNSGPGGIEIFNWSFGMNNPVTINGGIGLQSGKPKLGDITIYKKIGDCSSDFLTNFLTVKSFPSVSLQQIDRHGAPVLLVQMDVVFISSYQLTGYENQGVPYEAITLSFGKIQVTEQASGASKVACFNVQTSSSCANWVQQ